MDDYRAIYFAVHGVYPSVPFHALPAAKRQELEEAAKPDEEVLPARRVSPIKGTRYF